MIRFVNRVDDALASDLFVAILAVLGLGLAAALWTMENWSGMCVVLLMCVVLYVTHLVSKASVLKRDSVRQQ